MFFKVKSLLIMVIISNWFYPGAALASSEFVIPGCDCPDVVEAFKKDYKEGWQKFEERISRSAADETIFNFLKLNLDKVEAQNSILILLKKSEIDTRLKALHLLSLINKESIGSEIKKKIVEYEISSLNKSKSPHECLTIVIQECRLKNSEVIEEMMNLKNPNLDGRILALINQTGRKLKNKSECEYKIFYQALKRSRR